MNKLSPITAKWIGIRAERIGQASKILKKYGFWRENAAALNNRNGCDYIMPCAARGLNDFKELFIQLEKSGFIGIAFQWTDLQWKHNAGLTNAQWQNRKMIN